MLNADKDAEQTDAVELTAQHIWWFQTPLRPAFHSSSRLISASSGQLVADAYEVFVFSYSLRATSGLLKLHIRPNIEIEKSNS